MSNKIAVAIALGRVRGSWVWDPSPTTVWDRLNPIIRAAAQRVRGGGVCEQVTITIHALGPSCDHTHDVQEAARELRDGQKKIGEK